MGGFPIIVIFIAGLMLLGVYLWIRQRERYLETTNGDPGTTAAYWTESGDPGAAVLVATQLGQLLHINEAARQLVAAQDVEIDLEFLASQVEPAETFFGLLTAEMQTAFELCGQWVRAASHHIPTDEGMRIVIVMQPQVTATDAATRDGIDMSLVMQMINDINGSVSSSMGMEPALQHMLQLITRHLPADAGEINLWDTDRQFLEQRSWIGDATYLITIAEQGNGYQPGVGLAGWIAQHHRAVRIDGERDTIETADLMRNMPYKSAIAIPIMLGERFIGTLGLFSETAGTYTPAHLNALQATSLTVANIIHNIELYLDQAQRISEIASLQEIAEQPRSDEGASTVFRLLTERMAKLVDAEICGVYLYDADTHTLVPQLPFHGVMDDLARRMTIHVPPGSVQREVWESNQDWVSADLSDDTLVDGVGLRPLVEVIGLRNSVMVPLMVGQERIGVISISNKRGGDFSLPDVQRIKVLATQAAIVVENLRLYREEQRIDNELLGLQEMTQAIGALTSEGDIFGEMAERIGRLMGSRMCGILLYDSARSQLVPQLPFYGIADDLIRTYRIDAPRGSVVEELWLEEDFWFSNRVQTEALVFAAGLENFAEQAGVEKTLIAAMDNAGRRIGVVQVSNKHDGSDYTPNDARLLRIFATQAAAVIENTRLVREVQMRANQAESLRRIAERASAVLTPDQDFSPVLEEIAQFMSSQVVYINIIDHNTNALITRPQWVYGYEIDEPLVRDLRQPGFEKSVALSGRPYVGNDILNDPDVIEAYKRPARRYNLRSTVMVPLMVGERRLGELGVSNRTDRDYMADDVDVLKTIAAQISAALERLLVFEATGDNLRRRVEELDAIARVSNELTTTFDLDRILAVVMDEAFKATLADGCTVALLRDRENWRSPDKPEMARRLGVSIETMPMLADIETEAIWRGMEPVSVADYNRARLKPLPMDAGSGIAIAIFYLETPIGVLHAFAYEPDHFDDRAAGFLLTLSTKASLGYQNYAFFTQQQERGENLRRRVDQLNRIFELGQMIQTNTDVIAMMDAIAFSIQQSVGFDTVLMTLVDDEALVLRRVAQAGFPLDAFEETRNNVLSLDKLDALLREDYQKSGDTFFFPIEAVEDWYMPGIKALSTAYDDNRSLDAIDMGAWRDGDMLVVRITGQGGNLLGVIVLDRPHNNRRPNRHVLEVLEIFAHQAATMIENTRLFARSQRSADQEARVNEITARIASTLDVGDIIEAVAEGLRRLMPLHRLTLATRDAQNYAFDYVQLAVLPDDKLAVKHENRTTLQGSVLGAVYDDYKERYFTTGAPEVELYGDLRNWHTHGEKASLIVPLTTGGETIGALHVGSTQPGGLASQDLRNLITRVSQLISTTVQNARLFNQALNLQALNRSVVESIQQGIVVLDETERVINVNGFMKTHFGWDDQALRQHIFTYRPEMGEFLRDDLQAVLTDGIPRERVNQMMESDTDDRPIVRNFYIYPLISSEEINGAVMLVEDVTERSRLEETIESRANQLAALTEVSLHITSSIEREEVIELALNEMGWILPADTITIWKRTGSYLVLEGYNGFGQDADFDGLRVRINDDPRLEMMVEVGRAVDLSEIDAPPVHSLPGDVDAKSWLGVPLVHQGHTVGALVLTNKQPGHYTTREEHYVAQSFASQVAIALSNAELFQQAFERTSELGTLLEAARSTSMATSLDGVFRTVAELMLSSLDAADCTIMIFDEVDDELRVTFSATSDSERSLTLPVGMRYSLSDYPARRLALTQREVIVIVDAEDAPDPPPFPIELDELRATQHMARLLVPLVFGEQNIGMIVIEKTAANTVTQQEVRLANALGSQVASAIYNARLSDETNKRFEELLIINQLSQAISSTLNLDDMLPRIRDQVPAITGAEEMYLALFNPVNKEITFPLAVGNGEDFEIPPRQLGTDEVSYIIKRKHTLSLGADYFSIEELRTSMKISNGEGDARSYMGVPILAGEQVLGVLAIRSVSRPRAFNLNDDRILTTVAAQLGAAIQNARLFEQITRLADDLENVVEERTNELEEERDRLDTLYQITSELARTLDMAQLLDRALGMVSKAVGASDGVIMLSDPATDQLYCRAWLNPNNLQYIEGFEYPTHPAEGLATWLLQYDTENDHVLVVDDLHEKPFWDQNAPGTANLRSALAVILENNEDPMGVMVLLSNRVGAFSESHLKLLVPAANQVAASINSSDLYMLIRTQAERLGNMLRVETEEAQKNSAILESIADGVMLADSSGTIKLFNSAAERILQMPREQAIGEDVSRLAGIYGQSAARWSHLISDWSQNADSPDLPNEYIMEQLEIGQRIVNVQLSPVYIGDEFLGTVSVFRDVTRDVEANRIKAQFIESVSHEFRTPLTPIKGYTDLLLMGTAGELNDSQSNFMQIIRDNIERLTVLVNDVLNIAKVDRGERLQMRRVNLQEIVPDVVENIAKRPSNKRKGLAVHTDVARNLPLITADRDKLRQIIGNLVDNAFNYTEPGGSINVRAVVDHDPKYVQVIVQDTGVGIPEEFGSRIWNRFERYDEHALSFEVFGTGLGLALVRELVQMHGGDAWFESEVGVGSTFYVRLPVEQPLFSVDGNGHLAADIEPQVGD